jgi:pyruvate dehydrogenase E2 component (dihydrolipoamide acetyltransferase)
MPSGKPTRSARCWGTSSELPHVSDAPRSFAETLPPWPQVDFAAFGEIEVKPLPRMRKLAAGFLARNWAMIPHVTHHDDADVTALEELRKQINAAEPQAKLTLLPFLARAVAGVLGEFPQFNASLDAGSGNVVYKKYCHVGIAVDTPNGLLVPVVRDCDKRSVRELGADIAALSDKARTKGLPLGDMSGGCFTISSLGGVGGTYFTPIINAPEVAILGVCRARWVPQRGTGETIDWRLLLPLSLSYDHRLINGADAARFTRRLADVIAQPSTLLD